MRSFVSLGLSKSQIICHRTCFATIIVAYLTFLREQCDFLLFFLWSSKIYCIFAVDTTYSLLTKIRLTEY